LTKAFVVELKDAGISVNDVMADEKKLGEEAYKASIQAALIYEKMSPLERLDFKKVLASLGFPPETIASIEKGTAALKQARAEAEASSWENWAPAFRKIGEAIQSAAQAAGAFFASLAASAGAFLADFGQRLVDAVNLSVQQVKDAFNGVVSAISNAFNAILSPIRTVLNTIGGWIDALLGKAQALLSVIGGLMGGGGGGSPDSGSGYASGGVVRGAPGVDANLAYLSAGEFVMRVAAVQKFGLPFMHSINALAAPRFAGGGLNAGGAPSLAGVSGSRNLHITFEGRTFGPATMSEDVAAALERFSVHSQLASAGRKQSWRR
jgi:phage-related protein